MQGFSHFPRSFPHRYVNFIIPRKITCFSGGMPLHQFSPRSRTGAAEIPGAGLFFLLQQHQSHAVDHAGKGPEHDDRACDLEHLRRHAGDEALWLCQDRHTKFFKIIWAAHFSVGRSCHGMPFGLNQHTHPKGPMEVQKKCRFTRHYYGSSGKVSLTPKFPTLTQYGFLTWRR